MAFLPTTADPNGPGTDGTVQYASRAAYETHNWFSMTSLVFGVLGAGAGAAVGERLGDAAGAGIGGAAGAALGIYLGNNTPPR